jgi:signal transduction histidine kinase
MIAGAEDVGAFITQDPRGKELPGYLVKLAEVLTREREAMMQEIDSFRLNVEHMSEIVAMQQNYASGASLVEECTPADLVEESLHITAISLSHHGVTVIRDFKPTPSVRVTRHKVLQILVNLLRNAKDAMDESGKSEKPMTITVEAAGPDRVRIAVRDTGVGIHPDNLARIFGFGFTTRENGHGFGLHSSANAASELGGKLSAQSDGLGTGAVFTLELPVARAPRRASTPSDRA